MQLHAISGSSVIPASEAKKDLSYICLECNEIVHLKKGKKRENHFYHPHKKTLCHQNNKSAAHIRMQLRIKSLIPDIILEKKIASRIADLCWEDQKIVFEIQCSPISIEESKRRSIEYAQAGYTAVWILHDRRFNRYRVGKAESYLRNHHTTFFTDGNTIYDQAERCSSRYRISRGAKMEVDLRLPQKNSKKCPSRSWPLSFHGDLLSSPHNLAHLSKKHKRYFQSSTYRKIKRGMQFLIWKILDICCE